MVGKTAKTESVSRSVEDQQLIDSLNDDSIHKMFGGWFDENNPANKHEGLNISSLLGLLFITIRASNNAMDIGQLTAEEAQVLEQRWMKLDAVLGLGDATINIPAEVQALLDQRTEARKAKDFAKSDELRKAIEALGWKVKDTAKGQELLPD